MRQYEAVILTMKQLGGVATLGQLYQHVLDVPGCEWQTKTPFASIRRIVQTRKEIYKIKPGLYGLVSKKSEIEQRGILAETSKNRRTKEVAASSHTYYQGILLLVGKMKEYDTFAPRQDSNKVFLDKTIGELRTLDEIPPFSYPQIVRRSQTVDATWFNERRMPAAFFEVEFAGDIQNSLLKFNDLQDFSARMTIVSDSRRRQECRSKLGYASFRDVRDRVKFLDFHSLVKQYEGLMAAAAGEVVL